MDRKGADGSGLNRKGLARRGMGCLRSRLCRFPMQPSAKALKGEERAGMERTGAEWNGQNRTGREWREGEGRGLEWAVYAAGCISLWYNRVRKR